MTKRSKQSVRNKSGTKKTASLNFKSRLKNFRTKREKMKRGKSKSKKPNQKSRQPRRKKPKTITETTVVVAEVEVTEAAEVPGVGMEAAKMIALKLWAEAPATNRVTPTTCIVNALNSKVMMTTINCTRHPEPSL